MLLLCATAATAQPPNFPPAGPKPPGMLPLPPGYRPRTPPPVPTPVPPRPTSTGVPGSGGSGKVMYFQKPADALIATGGSAAAGVAQLDTPARPPVVNAVPDTPATTLPPLPPARVAERPLTPPPPVVVMPAAVAYRQQPAPELKPGEGDIPPTTVQKKDSRIVPVDPKYIQLPPRESIFLVYDDKLLEEAIMERLRDDLKRDKKYTPQQEKYLVFPPLPVISPPGVPYQPKTAMYEPRKMIVEPNYVVHRRLHFEEKNSERAGWDLGPLSTLVSAAYFWKDALLWPQSIASGGVYGYWDTSAGKCLPGSPSPYYLYPPGLTCRGVLTEAAAITGGAFFFP